MFGDKLFTGVNDSSDKTVLPITDCLDLKIKNKQKCTQLSSKQNLKKIYTSKFFILIASVVDTADKH
jgi:hypothetical protein